MPSNVKVSIFFATRRYHVISRELKIRLWRPWTTPFWVQPRNPGRSTIMLFCNAILKRQLCNNTHLPVKDGRQLSTGRWRVIFFIFLFFSDRRYDRRTDRSDAFVTRHRRSRNIICLMHNIIRRVIVCPGLRKRVLQIIIIVVVQIKIPSDTLLCLIILIAGHVVIGMHSWLQ